MLHEHESHQESREIRTSGLCCVRRFEKREGIRVRGAESAVDETPQQHRHPRMSLAAKKERYKSHCQWGGICGLVERVEEQFERRTTEVCETSRNCQDLWIGVPLPDRGVAGRRCERRSLGPELFPSHRLRLLVLLADVGLGVPFDPRAL